MSTWWTFANGIPKFPNKKEAMNKILEEAVQKSRGNTPHNIAELMEIWKKKPIISWKRVLKRFVSSKKGKKTNTIYIYRVKSPKIDN